MARRPVRLLGLLVCGTFFSVAVAWGCAIWSVGGELYDFVDPVSPFEPVDNVDRIWLQDKHGVSDDSSVVVSSDRGGFGFYRRDLFLLELEDYPTFPYQNAGAYSGRRFRAEVLRQTYAGWPFLTLYGEEWKVSDEKEWLTLRNGSLWSRTPYRPRWAVYVDVRVSDEYLVSPLPRPLPLMPLLPGFLLNAATYAFTVWLFIRGAAGARVALRRWRRVCLRCGYDLRGDLSSGCPECGWRRKEKDAQQPA